MSGLNMGYRGRTTRGPSGNIFNSKFRIDQLPRDPGKGFFFFDDFINAGGLVGSNVGGWSGYKTYEDNNGAITQLASETTGVLRFSTSAADNNECWLTSGYGTGVMGMIADAAAKARMLAFEARIRVSQITAQSLFVGMAEEGLAAADTISDAGALAAKDFIGFRVLEADPDGLDIVYKEAAGAEQVVKEEAQVLVASTWYKVGFLYDPSASTSRKVSFFVDNVDCGSYVTAANIAAAAFPDEEELAILLGIKAHAAADKIMDVDWVACAGLYE